ncbi:Uncharacterized protein FWK35_00015239 [Aphis craccivora]|uniref:Uncharacterized protein n=1 Tax=Aphis craccivora TaxID=307492 RepID=A0A6G0YFD5_APHCR|nr:Uncharacterized protein FWK35_00015239 [Aphis craccivora]
MVTDKNLSHYVYISNFSRLIRAQKTKHTERVVFCKRCFTSFDNQIYNRKLSGEEGNVYESPHDEIDGGHVTLLNTQTNFFVIIFADQK